MMENMKLLEDTDLNDIEPCGIYKVDCESSNLPKGETTYMFHGEVINKIGEKQTT